MKGCRPLTDPEIQAVLLTFSGQFASRDRAIFLLGIKAGFRISEILSLKVSDVYSFGQIVDRVSVRRCNMKNRKEGRTVVLHTEAKAAIAQWVAELTSAANYNPNWYLFKSRKGTNRPVSRNQAWRILKLAFQSNQMSGKLGTHSMRKTFADRIHEKLGRDIIKTRSALNHLNIQSTISYLSFKNELIDEAILSL